MLGERFWSKVDRPNADGCREWVAARDRHGYGRFNLAGRCWEAYKLAWEEKFGTVPEGLELDHLCRNRACVNPDHLEPVTHAENQRRSVQPSASWTHCVNGHEFSEANTYIRPRGGRSCRRCTAESQRRYQERKATSRNGRSGSHRDGPYADQ